MSVFIQRKGHVFSQGHGTPQRSGLVKDPIAPHDGLLPGGIAIPETHVIVEDPSLGRFFEADEAPEKCALAASAPTHDDENITVLYGEIEIALNHKASVGHGEVAHFNARRYLSHMIFHK